MNSTPEFYWLGLGRLGKMVEDLTPTWQYYWAIAALIILLVLFALLLKRAIFYRSAQYTNMSRKRKANLKLDILSRPRKETANRPYQKA